MRTLFVFLLLLLGCARSPLFVTSECWIIYLNPDRFPAWDHTTKITPEEVYERMMARKAAEYVVRELGLDPKKILSIRAVKFTMVVVAPDGLSVDEVNAWNQEHDGVMMVQQGSDYLLGSKSIDPDPNIRGLINEIAVPVEVR